MAHRSIPQSTVTLHKEEASAHFARNLQTREVAEAMPTVHQSTPNLMDELLASMLCIIS